MYAIRSYYELSLRGDQITLFGEEPDVKLAKRVLEELYGLLSEGYPLYPSDVNHAIQILSGKFKARLKDIFLDAVYVTSKKRIITPKSLAQKEYIEAIRSYDIVFGIGPAGTGKTYLAMATAISALKGGEIHRIILVRPAVEAGRITSYNVCYTKLLRSKESSGPSTEAIPPWA